MAAMSSDTDRLDAALQGVALGEPLLEMSPREAVADQFGYSGDELNTAVYLARFGYTTSLVRAVGVASLSDSYLKVLAAESFDARELAWGSGGETFLFDFVSPRAEIVLRQVRRAVVVRARGQCDRFTAAAARNVLAPTGAGDAFNAAYLVIGGSRGSRPQAVKVGRRVAEQVIAQRARSCPSPSCTA